MKTQHTPTPWRFTESTLNGVPTGETLWLETKESELPLMVMQPYAGMVEEARANAAFIVRAVNVHEEILEVLKDELEWLLEMEKYSTVSEIQKIGLHNRATKLSQAIAKAGGK